MARQQRASRKNVLCRCPSLHALRTAAAQRLRQFLLDQYRAAELPRIPSPDPPVAESNQRRGEGAAGLAGCARPAIRPATQTSCSRSKATPLPASPIEAVAPRPSSTQRSKERFLVTPSSLHSSRMAGTQIGLKVLISSRVFEKHLNGPVP